MVNAFKVDHVKSKDMDNTPVSNGQFLCVTDQERLYFDYDGIRMSFNDIIIVESKDELNRIPHLIPGKFYYIKDPNDPTMLFYNGINLIGGSNKYVHPVYKIEEGIYRKVTVNKYGHVIAANNDILTVEEGGTGCDSIDKFKKLLSLPEDKTDEIAELKNEIISLKETVKSLTDQINNIKLSYENDEFYMSTVDNKDGES